MDRSCGHMQWRAHGLPLALRYPENCHGPSATALLRGHHTCKTTARRQQHASLKTVFGALHRGDVRMSEATRERVRAAADELGYGDVAGRCYAAKPGSCGGDPYPIYQPPLLMTVAGAQPKALLVRDDDVQVLHGFNTVASATAYLSSDLFTRGGFVALKPLGLVATDEGQYWVCTVHARSPGQGALRQAAQVASKLKRAVTIQQAIHICSGDEFVLTGGAFMGLQIRQIFCRRTQAIIIPPGDRHHLRSSARRSFSFPQRLCCSRKKRGSSGESDLRKSR